LAGLDIPDSGKIWFGDKLMFGSGVCVPPKSRNAGFMFQSYAVWPHMRVYDNIAYPLRVRRLNKTDVDQKVKQIAGIVGIPELLSRYPAQLSGGQQQRVAIARSLVYEPSVLLLDEPLSNLDAKLREQMCSELTVLQEMLGTTTVYVTHNQEEALSMSDQIILMRDGVAIQTGSPQELFRNPTSRFSAEFLGVANFLDGVVKERNDAGLLLIETDAGLKLWCRNSTDLKLGNPCLVMIRLDHVSVSLGKPESVNMFKAHINRKIFKGEKRELWLDINNISLRAFVDSTQELNDEVYISIDPANIMFVSQDAL
jgi:iron(III) transport system ATP-binding protein